MSWPCLHDEDGRIPDPIGERILFPLEDTIRVAGVNATEILGSRSAEWRFPIPPSFAAKLQQAEDADPIGAGPEIATYRIVEHGTRIWRVNRVGRCESCDRIVEHGSWLLLTYRTLELHPEDARKRAQAQEMI